MLFSVLLACLGGCPSPGAVYDFCCFYKPVVATHTIGQAEATEVQQIYKFGPHKHCRKKAAESRRVGKRHHPNFVIVSPLKQRQTTDIVVMKEGNFFTDNNATY